MRPLPLAPNTPQGCIADAPALCLPMLKSPMWRSEAVTDLVLQWLSYCVGSRISLRKRRLVTAKPPNRPFQHNPPLKQHGNSH